MGFVLANGIGRAAAQDLQQTLLLMKSVGIGGYLSPPVAAWSTDLLFTVLALWLLRVQE